MIIAAALIELGLWVGGWLAAGLFAAYVLHGIRVRIEAEEDKRNGSHTIR